MGITHVIATVKSLDATEPSVEAKFLVDTGSINCLLPASILKRAGVQPLKTEVYELADGQQIEFPVGVARIGPNPQARARTLPQAGCLRGPLGRLSQCLAGGLPVP